MKDYISIIHLYQREMQFIKKRESDIKYQKQKKFSNRNYITTDIF
jgi:hypothetical protein